MSAKTEVYEPLARPREVWDGGCVDDWMYESDHQEVCR